MATTASCLAFLALGATGCDQMKPIRLKAEKWLAQVESKIPKSMPGSSPSPQASPSASPMPVVTALPSGDPLYSENALRAKANAELLSEMYQVVFLHPPTDRAFFGTYVDSMNQGASLEGVYNGFTHSAFYRALESNQKGASPEALRVFAEELALLEEELPKRTYFDEKSALPLPKIQMPDGSQPPVMDELEFKKRTEHDELAEKPVPQASASPELSLWVHKYVQIFVGSSIYTLKRVLGDEALKVIDSKREYPEKFALWYSKWVVRMSQRKVDFGLELRNKPDEAFHYKWAMSAGLDRTQWEILNRLHRVLNEANRQKP